MRRLIVELPVEKLEPFSPIHRVESFEILHILRLTPDEFAGLVNVEFKGSPLEIEDLFPSSRNAEVTHELLEKNNGAYTYFIASKSRAGLQHATRLSGIAAGSYISVPFEVKNGELKVSFLGNAKQMKRVLESLDRSKMRYRVISLSDAKLSPNSPLARLTRKQREVLAKAYELGYYDKPRRINSEQLAKKLDLAKSTVVAHRRKAERHLLAEVLGES
jgi:predicted DNA binding protein